VATLSVIRRLALREQLSIREISRRTGLARNTVMNRGRWATQLCQAGELQQARSIRREALHLASYWGNKVAQTAAHFAAAPHTSA